MPLNKATIDVPFGLGIDNRTDEKNVLPGKLVTLENAVFDKMQRVAKRAGLEPVVLGPASAAITTASGRLYANNGELIVREDTQGSTYGQEYDASINNQKSPTLKNVIFPKLEADIFQTGAASISQLDGAVDPVGKAIGLTASPTTLSVFDVSTKKLLTVATSSTLSAPQPRVLPALKNGEFILGWAQGSIIIMGGVKLSSAGVTVGVASPQNWGTAGSLTADATAPSTNDFLWDWVLDATGANLYVVSYNGTTIVLTKVNTTTWATSNITFTPSAVPTSIGVGINGSVVGICWTQATGIFFRSYTTALVLATATTTLLAAASTYELSTITGSGSSFFVHVQESTTPAATYNRRVVWSAMSTTGTGFTAKFLPGCGLASKMGAESSTCALVYDTTLQKTIFFRRFDDGGANTTSYFQGRTLYARHAGLLFGGSTSALLPNGQDFVSTTNAAAREFFTAQLVQTESVATALIPTQYYGAGWVQAQQPASVNATGGFRPYPSTQFQGRTIFGGGALHRFSGSAAEVLGFLLYPEITAAASGSGSTLVAGTYGIICTYECIDFEGNVSESGVSPPVNLVVTAAQNVAITIQNYRIEQEKTNVYVVVYLTLPGGTTYYRYSRAPANPTTNSTTVNLSALPAALASSAILYSQGEQENAQPDSPVALFADQDRVWVTPGSARNQVMPSKPFSQGISLAFYPSLFRQVAAAGDAITAISRQDERLFAFKSSSVFVASGAGPDATGGNDDLGEFNELFTNFGARDCISVVKAATGLYINDASSDLWFISRDLQQSRVGQDVENYTGGNMVAASYCSVQKQTRFLYASSNSYAYELVRDEENGQWSYNPRVPAISATGAMMAMTYFNGQPHYLIPNDSGGLATLCRENPTVFADNINRASPYYSLKLVTAWMKPGQVLQGYGRIYRALLLGDNLANNTLQVRVRFDYETTWSETHTISSANATVGGTAWQPEVRFQRQKCESFQLEISDVNPTGQGFNLSGLELLVGVKPGTNRQNTAKRF